MSADRSSDSGADIDMPARARAAHEREVQRGRAALADFRIDDADRLTDRTRATLSLTLQALAAGLAADLWQRARSRLGSGTTAPGRIATNAVYRRLVTSGVLTDDGLVSELLGRIRQAEIADALSPIASDPARPSLLVRLVDAPDATVADLARGLLSAEAYRRDDAAGPGLGLPDGIYRRVVWWVAAAVRAEVEATPAIDRAIGEAAAHIIGLHDDADTVEAAAARLAAAIDARPGELEPLLIESLADRQLALFIAVVARAGGLDYSAAREVILEPPTDRSLLLFLSLGLNRRALAQIALAITDADPRRDADTLPDQVDEAMSVPLAVIDTILSPLRLHPDFRDAIDDLAIGMVR